MAARHMIDRASPSYMAEHFLTKEVRAAPASFFASAWALQISDLPPAAGMALLADRHWLMNDLRASPLSFLAPASALQVFILSCCAVAAKLGAPAQIAKMAAA